MTCYNANDPRFRAENDSATIQNAINATREGDCRAVVIPRHNARTGECCWVIDKTLLLPNDITVYLDDCFLTLADGVYENIFRNELAFTEAALAPENEQHGIRIVGLGNAVLDGGKDNGLREQKWTPDQPMPITGCLVMLQNVRNYALENFKCQRMRYWAINQLACRRGRISHIDFDFIDRHPNQDGINFRIGCSEIAVENVTGVTGDDVIALSAFPCSRDKDLLPKGYSPDIHDIRISDVQATTVATVVALRTTDGAKIYNVTVENVTDVGQTVTKPWGVVRLGENNWFTHRPAEMGEMDNITVRNIRAFGKGCIYLGGALSNAHISGIYADGNTLYAVSTYQGVQIFWETGNEIHPGASLKNVVIENVFYTGKSIYREHPEDRYTELTYLGEKFGGCALDFRCLRDTDVVENVTLRNVHAREGAPLLLAKEGYGLKIAE